ncbi:MAG TPA: erythromycin esterase family protein [Polyangiaceae bacterium]|nr:erythromycin esterase family protein [Polyangiaceae bacterium]
MNPLDRAPRRLPPHANWTIIRLTMLRKERAREVGLERLLEAVDQVQSFSSPLQEDRDLDRLIARIGDARYVLLGEASHGTTEFYTWRTRLTRRLIREKGFRFVAVEGDWPECSAVNRYVRAYPDAPNSALSVLQGFQRWPSWMWANREVMTLVQWLRGHNAVLPEDQRVGFYGLDVYSLWRSMSAVIGYLDRKDPEAAERVRHAYECFAPFEQDEEEYARATVLLPTSCEDDVIQALCELQAVQPSSSSSLVASGNLEFSATANARDREAWFDAEQNALVAKNAELYYRTMVRGGTASWNVRDMHMAETLDRLAEFHGPEAKAIVWEHNSHVGDARFTDMGRGGELNLGQLARERHEREGVFIVGFSTYQGTVIAGDAWGAPFKRLAVPPARPGSWDDVLHQASRGADALLLFPGADAPDVLLAPRGQRAIGVVYRPQYEQFGNYVPTVLPLRYDALLFVDTSHALDPLPIPSLPRAAEKDFPETFPSGL